MKKITLTLIISLFCLFSFAQEKLAVLYSEATNFDTVTNMISIDTFQANNVWQIGPPQKTLFDSANSIPNVLVTDTINYYPNNNFSSFEIKVETDTNVWWGFMELSFKHKYDFDSINDGGFIEIKYGDDTTWTNLICDSSMYTLAGMPPFFQHFYSINDTILGGIPAFTGSQDEWETVFVDFTWLMACKDWWETDFDSISLRFSIKTDSIQTNHEGWMIDDLSLYITDPGDNLDEKEVNSFYSILYPNPATNKVRLEFDNKTNTKTQINIYNISGSLVKSYSSIDNNIEFDVRSFGKGTFIYNIIQDSKTKSSGKFLIN